jgi:hypothetical protein
VSAAGLAGILVWLVPLLVASGGVGGYTRALGTQASEDFAWVDMLWANPTPRRLALSIYETFVMPWSEVSLAIVIGATAAIGVIAAGRRDRSALLMLAAAFGPYAVFHLLLQETATVRYALPLLAPVAWLVARGVFVAGKGAPVVAAGIVAVAAVISLPAGVEYGSEPHPAFRAITDARERASRQAPAGIYAHYSLRRPLQVSVPNHVPVVEPRRSAEWLGLVEYWRSGGTRPVWFLADPRRTDLDLIDPHARDPARYRWAVADRPELTGTRPLGVDWYRFEPPGWFAGEGWSLTPETGGVARASGLGPDRRPVEAYVRRRSGPMHMMIGGGRIGASESAVTLDLMLDGVRRESWTVEPRAGARFLRFIDLPQGVPDGEGNYALLTVGARPSADGQSAPPMAIRQFDIQNAADLIHGFGEGWHDEEYDNATGLRWRWTSGRSLLRLAPPQNVRLTLRGESPLRYFDEPPVVRVMAGEREIGLLRPEDDFEWTVTISRDDIAESGGALTIITDRVYLPGQAEGTGDTRQLGLRLFDIRVHPVAP